MNTNGSLFDFFNTKKLHIPIQHDDGCRAWLIMYGKFRDYLIFAIAFKSKIIGFAEIISLSFFKKHFKLQKWLTHIKKKRKKLSQFWQFFCNEKKTDIYGIYLTKSSWSTSDNGSIVQSFFFLQPSGSFLFYIIYSKYIIISFSDKWLSSFFKCKT